jgi:hypothetical protein
MRASLEKAGSSMANVLKVQVSLVDPETNWEPMNEVYNTFFEEPRPARSYFGTTGFRRKGQLRRGSSQGLVPGSWASHFSAAQELPRASSSLKHFERGH